MPSASVRRRGTGDPEATLRPVFEKPRCPRTAIGSGGGRPPKIDSPPAQIPPATVLPEGTKKPQPAGMAARRAARLRRPSLDTFPEEGSSMVAARRNLLREIRRLAVRDELRAMRTRGRLVVPLVLPAPSHPAEKDAPQPPPRRI